MDNLSRRPASLKIATLLIAGPPVVPISPDYNGFLIPDEFRWAAADYAENTGTSLIGILAGVYSK